MAEGALFADDLVALREAAIRNARDAVLAAALFHFELAPGRAGTLVERLHRAGFLTLADVYRVGAPRVLGLRGVGRTQLRAINRAFYEHGFDVEHFDGHTLRHLPREAQLQALLSRQVPTTINALRDAAKRLEKLAGLLEELTDSAGEEEPDHV